MNDIVALFNSPIEWSPIVTSTPVKYGPILLELSIYADKSFVYASPSCGVCPFSIAFKYYVSFPVLKKSTSLRANSLVVKNPFGPDGK